MEIKLDKYQKKVIKQKRKNLLVLAGAGSGKTFTIVQKIKKIISDGIKPNEILCISFTKKSSKNLEEKLKKQNILLKVETFHSLGYKIINKYKTVNVVDDKLLNTTIEKTIKKSMHLREILNLKFIRVGKNDKVFKKLEKEIILSLNYKNRLKEIMKTFINLYKSGNNKISDFSSFNKINKQKHIYDQKIRHRHFLNLIKYTIIKYQKELIKTKQIDFNDMINEAIKIVKKQNINNYKYIIIDEYQDTSLNKTLLIKEIIKKTGAKIIAVGDDWQSIYRFTGSNLDVFSNFKKTFPKSKIIKLKKTYRNSKELVKISRKFIQKNPYQFKKKIKSDKSITNPIEIYYYENNIKEIWNKIIKKTSSKNLLILGRNNNDINLIPNNKDKFLTIHKSKGLESKNTIIVNLENRYNSLPSKTKQSEYLEYVNPKIDNFPYAEERRLFYVALTRCQNKNYLIVKKDNPSVFIKELIKSFKIKPHNLTK